MQKQTDQESQNQEQQYDPHKTPADLDMAKKHLKAKAVGLVRNIELINTSEICPCCGCIIEKEKVSLLCKLEDLGFLGAGVSLYFFFIKYCITFLFFIGLICSIFNILRNASGSNCSAIPQCQSSFINNLSIINRNDANGQFQTQAGLNFLTTITLIVASVILRKQMSTMSKQINIDNITAGDFTVMVTNLQIGTTEQQLVDYIKSWTKNYGEIQIIKVNFAYDISNYIKIKRKHQELVLKQIKEKASLKEKFQDTSHLLTKISQEIDELEKQISITEENFKTGNFVRSGAAFVTFGSDNTAELVTKIFKRNFFSRIIRSITRFGSLNGKVISIKRAPEPNDIYWENLCYTQFEKFTSNLITHFFTAILLVAAFFIIFAISKAQDNIQSTSNKNDPTVVFLSFIASLFIFIINNGLNIIIRKFAIFEKHATLTYYFIGVAQKSGIAQFLNTTIVVYIIKKIKLESQIYISGGLLYTIHFILLMNLVGSFNIFMNPFYFYKLWLRRKAEKGNKQFIEHTPQQKMNEIYEGPKFDFPAAYAKLIKLIMFASFYSYPAPLIVYISLGILILTYWFDKYHLISRCSMPDYLSHHLPEAMADFYLEFMIVVFCIGNIVFENLLFNKSSGLTIAALVLAILFWVADFDAIVNCICSNDSNQTQVRRYEYYSQYFLTDYERSNPVTAMKAIEEWTKKLQDNKIKEANKKQNLVFLSNYALNRPGMSSFYHHGFRQPQMNMMNQQYQQPQKLNMNFSYQQQFMPNQYRPQQPQFGGFPQSINQVIPMRQPQMVTDPAMMQNEINNLKQQQEQLRQQMLNNYNPMFQLNIISQLEMNNRRITYLESQINRQQPINIAPAIGFQSNLPNPIQDPARQSNFIQPQQNNLPNPLIVNPTNSSQINTQQSNQNNIQAAPNQLSSSYTNMQPQQIQPNNQNPMLYPQQPNQQIIQPQQQVYRNPNQQGSILYQPFNTNYQQQQQMGNPQVIGNQMYQQQAQQPVFQQNYYNQRPGFIPMMMPQQQQQQPLLQQGGIQLQQYK
ncbi:transmembrane protein, putative (macronuclear) [Tetrahymena thermophila SB210]|uniref:Transmembrane protein, putative n=1 Tax=Tetrahymena thermophila (strain SB210) TaxID=312017 RepID=Q22ZE2_TETTS|nr:transmembrane protein, putative [Tetrahymena thermophila SB210]EAR90379.2 transmembrane protein, putative [Tetrahymena thermophila SB210]|eukprot:XP_001010624.2 transmembrane protein, putative [Tetrahymena thermophila SB210]